MRNLLRKLAPTFLLNAYRAQKKARRNKKISGQKVVGEGATKESLVKDFQRAGLAPGDDVLVHSSLSQLGYVVGGPQAVIEALLAVIGDTGNLLMPSSPNSGLQLDYIRNLKAFDIKNSPSALGAITEKFRTMPGVARSAHPTEPVCCLGPDAEFYTSGHFGELTPYTKNSPFARLSERGGKILYMGVTLDNAGTNLHTLEDVVDVKLPIYAEEIFEVSIIFPGGERRTMKTKVHNPVQSAKRKCDGLIPLFKQERVMQEAKIAQARTLVVDAKLMLEVMIRAYNEHGVTMYTPEGE